MRRLFYFVGLLLLVMVFTVPAWADLSIGFESPTYTVGPLVGQDSWTGAENWNVVTSWVSEGTQSAYSSGPGYVQRPLTGQSLRNGSTVMATVKMDSTVSGCYSSLWLLDTSGNPYAALYLNPSNLFQTLNSTATGWNTVLVGSTPMYWYPDEVITMTFKLDFTNSRWKAEVNNLSYPAAGFTTSWNTFSSAVTPATAAGDMMVGGKGAWLDNIVVTETPAPKPLNISFEPPIYNVDQLLNGQDGWVTGGAWYVSSYAIAGTASALVGTYSTASRSITDQILQDGTTLNVKVRWADPDLGVSISDGQVWLQNSTTGDTPVGINIWEDGWVYYWDDVTPKWINTGRPVTVGDVLQLSMKFFFSANRWQLGIRNITEGGDTFTTGWLPLPANASSTINTLELAGYYFLFDDINLTQGSITLPDPILLKDAKKTTADGTNVCCTGYVSAKYGGWFNIEDADRTIGMVVEASDTGLTLGQQVKIAGIMTTFGSGERGLAQAAVLPMSGSTIIEPLGVTNKAIGGGAFGFQGGVVGGTGLNNIGLLVRTTGRVSSGSGSTFTLDDGSGVSLQAWYGGALPANGSYLAATGTVSCLNDGSGNLTRRIMITGFTTE